MHEQKKDDELMRKFEVARQRIDGTFRTTASIRCSQCGCVEDVSIGAGSTMLPDQAVAKKFAAKGWVIGSSEKKDLCYDCSFKRKEKPVLTVVKTQEPRVMERDDRRIIFDKLNGVYLDEKRGYEKGWSDHRVATEMGVPRKWVEQIREENFGTVAANEDMASFASEADALCRDAKKMLEDARKMQSDVAKVVNDFPLVRLKNIEERISKVDRLASEVRKLLVTG